MTGDAAEPRQIGSYEILAKLADGGVGTVYLARRRGPADFQRLVAIKRLHPQFAAASSFVTMFTDEARLAARIHHANVVSIVELGADDDGYYVVMEYVEGSNLGHFHWHATKIRGQATMPRAVALRIVLDALSGLHAAHEIEDDDGTIVNLVHRDVSPQNILIGVDGLARLGDFGIARASALRAFETRGAALKGKLEYMAPEQIECKEVDRTTDLFAMGIVLWEVLTGRRLFPAANQVTTIQRVCFDPIPSPRTFDPTISPELERICKKALERPRPRRYATAAEFSEALETGARADGGIATQREVAACMKEVLGAALPTAKSTLRERARSDRPGPVPNLGAGSKGNAFTDALPASDPMVRIPTSIKRLVSDAASPAYAGPGSTAHPAVSNDPIDTEPYGEAPPVGARVGDNVELPREESSVTVVYDERLPMEVMAEAGMRARAAERNREPSSDRTLALGDLGSQFGSSNTGGAGPSGRPTMPDGYVPASRPSAPTSSSQMSSPTSSSGRMSSVPSSRAPLSSGPPRASRSQWGIAVVILALGIFAGAAVGGFGYARLTQRRAAAAASAAASAASASAASPVDGQPTASAGSAASSAAIAELAPVGSGPAREETVVDAGELTHHRPPPIPDLRSGQDQNDLGS